MTKYTATDCVGAILLSRLALCSPAVAVNEMSFAVLTRLANVAYTQHAATQNGPHWKCSLMLRAALACCGCSASSCSCFCCCCYLFGCLFVVRLFVSVKFCDNRHTNFNGISNVVCQLSSTLSLFYYLSIFFSLAFSLFPSLCLRFVTISHLTKCSKPFRLFSSAAFDSCIA